MNITITADTLNSYHCNNHYLTNEYLGWRKCSSFPNAILSYTG